MIAKHPRAADKCRRMKRLTQSLLTIIALLPAAAFAQGLKYELAPNFFDKQPGDQPQGACHGGVALD